ncbi:hypothetical protein C0Z16_16635 [Paraburkholderia rhynchosiae]|uniref:Uncharacterized protein n=1 Tax=Paraburkholderia rhynchosiae TaxID=487049 RepID=A0ABX4V7F2_9BURK|nr:hypothetical protein C0Z16_16635 [Paraburkholderia rhynchosiae]
MCRLCRLLGRVFVEQLVVLGLEDRGGRVSGWWRAVARLGGLAGEMVFVLCAAVVAALFLPMVCHHMVPGGLEFRALFVGLKR